MATGSAVGLKERRQALLQEISIFRHAMRDHAAMARRSAVQAGRSASTTMRAVSVAPALATFLAGLLKGRGSAHRDHRDRRTPGVVAKLRTNISRILAAYAMWKVFRAARAARRMSF